MKASKSVLYIFLLHFLSYGALYAQNLHKYTINEAWIFNKEHGVEKIISFPHTWNAQDAGDDEPGFYRGKSTYKKKMYIPNSYKEKTVYIYFEGANQVTNLYINGLHVGEHKGGYTRFNFEISKFLKWNENNSFEIVVTNAHDEMIPPLSADFTFFGGIYRDVYLEVKENLHISPTDMASTGIYIATPKVDKSQASVSVKMLINNTLDQDQEVILKHAVYDPQGIEVYKIQMVDKIAALSSNLIKETSFQINSPLLWSIESPQLYTLKTTIVEKSTKKLLDESLNTFGLRWYSFSADKGFFLNGNHVKLIGTNRHQDYLNKGNALEDAYHVQDIRLLKSMGGNFIRISHYPQDPLILEMCDKLGIVASVEIPIVNAVTEHQEFLDNSIFMAEEMVKQNYNHPALVIWSYMNEVMLRPPYTSKDAAYGPYCTEVNRQAQAIENKIRELDPFRHTMIAFHGSVSAYEDAKLFDVPMIIGWNLYQGWYGDGLQHFDTFLTSYRNQYPTKPTLISEYGADVDTRIHSFKPERFDFSVEYGDLYHEHYRNTILANDFIAGAAIWNLNDFHSEPRNDAVPHINSKGITGLNRIPKNTFYLYKAHLTTDPFVKIASTDWQNRSGEETLPGISTQKIKVYSNQDKVMIYHNGKKIGQIRIKNNVGEIEIPFKQGQNLIEARVKKSTDIYMINFDVIPRKLGPNFQELNVMLGSNRYFEEKDTKTSWVPEKQYEVGGWGYVGGKQFKAKTKFGQLPAAALNILGTDLDPIFQTQRVNIEQFKADVSFGRYAIYLYWADLTPNTTTETLVYNLGNDAIMEDANDRVFDVLINASTILENFDIPNEVGTQQFIVKKFMVDVKNSDGITVEFKPKKGNTILNAIKILKVD
jgi:beta-galactosidase